MTEENKTGCVCPLAGYCSKHQVNKTPHLHKLCQNHPGYFKMWEECRGPGQQGVNCNREEVVPAETPQEIKEITEVPTKMPSLFKQAKNLTSAVAKHIMTGGGRVDPSVKEARLAICRECPLYDAPSGRCKDCGCFLATKTDLPSSRCPKGLW